MYWIPDIFSPWYWISDTFRPWYWISETFGPLYWIPDTFSPRYWIPDTFSPRYWIPDTFSPSYWIPDTFSQSYWIPEAFNPKNWILSVQGGDRPGYAEGCRLLRVPGPQQACRGRQGEYCCVQYSTVQYSSCWHFLMSGTFRIFLCLPLKYSYINFSFDVGWRNVKGAGKWIQRGCVTSKKFFFSIRILYYQNIPNNIFLLIFCI